MIAHMSISCNKCLELLVVFSCGGNGGGQSVVVGQFAAHALHALHALPSHLEERDEAHDREKAHDLWHEAHQRKGDEPNANHHATRRPQEERATEAAVH